MAWIRKQLPQVLDVTASILEGRNSIQKDLEEVKKQYEKQNYLQLEPGARNHTWTAVMNMRNNELCRKGSVN